MDVLWQESLTASLLSNKNKILLNTVDCTALLKAMTENTFITHIMLQVFCSVIDVFLIFCPSRVKMG